jgi:hypothetical protein
MSDTNDMFADVWTELRKMSLKPQPKKLQVMPNQWVRDKNVRVVMGECEALRVEQLEVLGCIIAGEASEEAAYKHRIVKSWQVFHKWREPLCCREVPIKNRAELWLSTVRNSMTWALETTRGSMRNLKLLRAAQRRQFVRMIGCKRWLEQGVVEDWVSFQKRSYRQAIEIINEQGLDVGCYLKQKKTDFMGHVSRFGIGEREDHLVKHLLLWRPLQWWKLQQKEIALGNPFVHPRAGRFKRYVDQIHRNWINRFSKQARMWLE